MLQLKLKMFIVSSADTQNVQNYSDADVHGVHSYSETDETDSHIISLGDQPNDIEV